MIGIVLVLAEITVEVWMIARCVGTSGVTVTFCVAAMMLGADAVSTHVPALVSKWRKVVELLPCGIVTVVVVIGDPPPPT